MLIIFRLTVMILGCSRSIFFTGGNIDTNSTNRTYVAYVGVSSSSWSSTVHHVNSDIYIFSLDSLNSTMLYPSINDYYRHGRSIRCLAR